MGFFVEDGVGEGLAFVGVGEVAGQGGIGEREDDGEQKGVESLHKRLECLGVGALPASA